MQFMHTWLEPKCLGWRKVSWELRAGSWRSAFQMQARSSCIHCRQKGPGRWVKINRMGKKHWAAESVTVRRTMWQHARHRWFRFMVKVQLSLTTSTDQSNKEALDFCGEVTWWEPQLGPAPFPTPFLEARSISVPVIVYQNPKSREGKREQRTLKSNEENCRVNDLAWEVISEEVCQKDIQMRYWVKNVKRGKDQSCSSKRETIR